MNRLSLLTAMLLACFACDTTFGQNGADDCAGAVDITGLTLVSFDNTAVTQAVPTLPTAINCGAGGGDFFADVWYSWTAPANGALTLSTCNVATGIDTDLALWDGTGGCAALAEVACNGDGPNPPCANFTSLIDNASVLAGTTYIIQIGGWDAPTGVGTGDLELTFTSGTLPPGNLNCTYDDVTGDTTVAFDAADNYVDVAVSVNGNPTTNTGALAAGPQSVVLAGLGQGVNTICLVADDGASGPSVEACCDVFVPVQCPPTVDGTLVPIPTVTPFIGCVSCNAAGINANNSYLRIFDVVNGYGVSDDFTLECVTTAVDASNVGSASGVQPVHIRVYVDPNGGNLSNFQYIAATVDVLNATAGVIANTAVANAPILIYEEQFGVPQLNDELFNFAFGTGLQVDPGGFGATNPVVGCLSDYTPTATLVIEIYTPDDDGSGNGFFMAATDTTAAPEIGVSYLSSVDCGIATPTSTASIGFGNNRYIMDIGYSINVVGACGTPGGVASLSCAQTPGDTTHTADWVDAGGAASWTVEVAGNLVATLPAATTTFTTAAQTPYTSEDLVISAWTGAGGTGSVINQRSCGLVTSPAYNWAEGALVVGPGGAVEDVTTPYIGTTGQALDVNVCDNGTGVTQIQNDFFLRYTAGVTGDVLVSTCLPGTTIVTDDTMTAVYTYDAVLLDDPTLAIACNDDPGAGANATNNPDCGTLTSELIFSATSGTEYLVKIGTFNAAGIGDLEWVINDCVPVTDLAAAVDCSSGDVTLTWTPTANATSQEVLRDNVSIATLTSTDNMYVDLGVASGDYTYALVTDCGSGPNPAELDVSVLNYSGQTDIVLAQEGLQSLGDVGLTDSGPIILQSLLNNGRNAALVRASVLDFPCVNDAAVENVWVATGTFPADYRGDVAELDALGALSAAGKGVYFEGGDHWGFVHVDSTFDDHDGVDDAGHGFGDGDDTFGQMDGQNSGLGLDLGALVDVGYTQDQAGIDFTDQLNVASGGTPAADANVDDAGSIWVNSDDTMTGEPAYITGIYAQGSSPAGNVISSSWEFGGYGGDLDALAMSYIAALEGGSPPGAFIRGDANADGSTNIADAIYILGVLFPGGGTPPVPPCDDSTDANDDGGRNIADAIALLGVLFPSTSPPPTLPAPTGACGPDPTADPFDCLSFPPCP